MKYIQKGLLVAAIILLVIGSFDGGFKDVRNKAVMICLECIGIG